MTDAVQRRRARRARGPHRRLAGRAAGGEPGGRRRRPRPGVGRAPLVRARARRGEGRLHDLVHLRQRTLHYETYVMPAPEENHAAVLRAPAAPQPEALRRRLRHRRRGRRVPRRPAGQRGRRRRRARPAPRLALRSGSSSSSGRPCASASPPGSRADPILHCISCHFDLSVRRDGGARPVSTRSGKR